MSGGATWVSVEAVIPESSLPVDAMVGRGMPHESNYNENQDLAVA